MKPSAVVPRNGSCTIPRRIPASFRGAICFAPWPLVPDTEICFCFGSRQCFICPCFLAFQHRYPSKNDFLSQNMSPSDKPKNKKTKMKRRRSFTCLSSLKFCSQGTELNCSARPHCPPWVIGCGFPHPNEEK